MKCQNNYDYCGNTAVVLVKVPSGAELWFCGDCYEDCPEGTKILDDVESRNERIMQDRMMGGR